MSDAERRDAIKARRALSHYPPKQRHRLLEELQRLPPEQRRERLEQLKKEKQNSKEKRP